MLKIQFKNSRREPLWVVEKTFSIGSAPDNRLVVEDPSVSAHHAKLVSQDGRCLLQNISDAGGTFVNGQPINERQVGSGDSIRCGNVEMEIVDPFMGESDGQGYWALIANASWLAGQEFPLTPAAGSEVLIGRGNQCDIVFPGSHLSREHARFVLGAHDVLVVDLHSTNGTYINDQRVHGQATAVAGDRIRLDIYSFALLGPRSAQSAAAPPAEAEPALSLRDHLPKRWKTRPTSPGNREEVAKRGNQTTAWLSALLLAALVVAAVYLLLALT